MDSDSDTEHQETKFTKGAVGRVLLIDVRDTNSSGAPARALDAVRAAVRSELRGGVRFTSVCFYNTTDGVRGVLEVLPLTTPSLSEYRKLQETDVTSHGQSAVSELADTLWHCSRTFASCSRALGERSVVLLAKLDDPPPLPQQRPALKRAIDLVNLGIDLHLVNISNEKYVPHQFYVDLLRASSNSRPGCELSLPDPVWNIGDIEKQLRLRSHRLAASSRLHFQLGGELKLAVGIYHLASKKDPMKKIHVTKDQSEIVSSNTTTVRMRDLAPSDEPGPSNQQQEIPLLKSELIFYQVYGGKRIEFTKEEISAMKTVFGPPGMKLLGFKPQSWLSKEKHYLKSCQFLFPDERSIEGSTRAFRALHRACEERKVLAVCMLRSRLSSHPRIVALWPCSRPLGLGVEVGFDIVHVPYLENRKDVPDPEEEISTASFPAEIQLLKDIVCQLEFKYTPDKFENPMLQSLYRAVEALALEEESVEAFTDTTIPPAKKFEGIDSELFQRVFGPFEVGGAKKRPSGGNLPAPKRPADEDIDVDLFSARMSTKEIHKYNVNDLKKILRWKNPNGLQALTGLRKDVLVNLIYQHCS